MLCVTGGLQLEWLQQELTSIKAVQKRAIIIGSAAPGATALTHSLHFFRV